jgi:hypothetical protein
MRFVAALSVKVIGLAVAVLLEMVVQLVNVALRSTA